MALPQTAPNLTKIHETEIMDNNQRVQTRIYADADNKISASAIRIGSAPWAVSVQAAKSDHVNVETFTAQRLRDSTINRIAGEVLDLTIGA